MRGSSTTATDANYSFKASALAAGSAANFPFDARSGIPGLFPEDLCLQMNLCNEG